MIKAELKGDKEAESFLTKVLTKVKKPEKFMESLGRRFVSITQKRIDEGIEPPNAPLTRAWKKNDLTLRDTGRLVASIDYLAGRDFVAWGTNLEYAPVQQLGGEIKAKNAKKLAIPAGWHTRRLMRKYGETPKKCIEGLKQAGWKIWFTDKAIMGQPPRKRGKAEPMVLFIRKERVEIPARPFLRFEEPEEKAVYAEIQRWLALK